jgi:hypothetical protein
MKNLLQVGQIFSCHLFVDLTHPPRADEPTIPDRTRLEFGNKTMEHHVTERKAGGWTRERREVVDYTPLDAQELGTLLFKVLETDMTGGGYGHGLHDKYPDGHQVVAIENCHHAPRLVRFYQSGCFRGLVEPKHVTWHAGPTDAGKAPATGSIWDKKR